MTKRADSSTDEEDQVDIIHEEPRTIQENREVQVMLSYEYCLRASEKYFKNGLTKLVDCLGYLQLF